jgi:hypothetical protein
LSFDTVHAITDHLYLADAAHTTGDNAAVVLLLHEHTDPVGSRRLVRAVEYPLLAAEADRGLPEQLLLFTRRLTTATDRRPPVTPDVGARLLASAVRYGDIDLTGDVPQVVQRIDAVDTDGRVYRLVRQRRDARPILLIDDAAVPTDTPATHPALVDILGAAAAGETKRS